ncbi:MAG: tRNA pseudouridine(55) synthase TruB [Nitrospiraceae bacterium]|nr:tRNA pseudouridine(55) synthase TruB [Nitrospiraceae bacterium]
MDSVILIDKPKGLTSQETVTALKRRLKVKKAGHTGTLDPIATGLLIVCTGEATKVSRFLTDLPKQYLATIKLGERTDTFDAEGKVTATGKGNIPEAALREAAASFRGRIKQLPPMYSALKVSGRPLYELARKGIEVEREEREVEVHQLDLLWYEPPLAGLLITCAKGTYVRTLADDIGQHAGTYAHITELRRTAIGPFSVENSCTPEGLAEKKPGAMLGIDEALGLFLEEAVLNEAQFRRAANGASFRIAGPLTGYLRIKGSGGVLMGIGKAFCGVVKMERLLHL